MGEGGYSCTVGDVSAVNQVSIRPHRLAGWGWRILCGTLIYCVLSLGFL